MGISLPRWLSRRAEQSRRELGETAPTAVLAATAARWQVRRNTHR